MLSTQLLTHLDLFQGGSDFSHDVDGFRLDHPSSLTLFEVLDALVGDVPDGADGSNSCGSVHLGVHLLQGGLDLLDAGVAFDDVDGLHDLDVLGHDISFHRGLIIGRVFFASENMPFLVSDVRTHSLLDGVVEFLNAAPDLLQAFGDPLEAVRVLLGHLTLAGLSLALGDDCSLFEQLLLNDIQSRSDRIRQRLVDLGNVAPVHHRAFDIAVGVLHGDHVLSVLLGVFDIGFGDLATIVGVVADHHRARFRVEVNLATVGAVAQTELGQVEDDIRSDLDGLIDSALGEKLEILILDGVGHVIPAFKYESVWEADVVVFERGGVVVHRNTWTLVGRQDGGDLHFQRFIR